LNRPFATPRLNGLRAVVCALLASSAVGCSAPNEAPAPAASPVVLSQDAEGFAVAFVPVSDLKSAFAQVDSVDAVSARARIGGTITELRVREGAEVSKGDLIARISDARLPLQAQAEDAQTQALRSQLAQAEADLVRFERLHKDGFYPTQKLDQARANVRGLADQVRAAQSQRAITVEASAQGSVLAPVAGRVLRVPARQGGVVMPGEELALVGSAFILKLRLPERHARLLQTGAEVAIEQPDGSRKAGRIARIYPALADGRVEADIEAEGLADLVFGERVRVWLPADKREALVVPAGLLTNRHGVDFARVKLTNGQAQDVVVRLGEPVAAPGIVDGVEVLSGLSQGDELVTAEAR